MERGDLADGWPAAASQLRRLGPPALDRGQLVRPRLIGVLAGRFDRRITLVVGGPGFGKSTLLAQALRENDLAPAGRDHWLSCTRFDADEQTLVEGVFAATGLASAAKGPPATAPELIGALHRLAPGSCLVLDDVHEILDGSAGHRALQAIVADLPSQCSLVVGSRRLPDLPVSGWMVKGQYAFVGEDDLRFTDGELAALAAAPDAPTVAPTSESTGGWPALVALQMAAGEAGGQRYLHEAVLAGLEPDARRLLAVLDAVGGADRELAAHAAAVSIDERTWESVAGLPLIQTQGGSGLLPHALWRPVLDDVLDGEERRVARTRTAHALLDRGRHDDAFSIFAELEDGDGCRAVVRAACAGGCTQLGFETMERWRRSLPADTADSAEARLLEGLAARDGRTFDPATLVLLRSASAEFAERGEVGPEVATLSELAFVAREQGREDVFEAIVERLTFLGFSGNLAEVEGYIHLGLGINAERAGDYRGMLAELAQIGSDRVSRQMSPRVEWLRAHCHLMEGRPEVGRPMAQRALDLAEDDFLGARYLLAYLDWVIDPSARSVAALPDICTERAATPFDQVYGGGVLTTLHAFVGHLDVARRGLGVVRRAGETFGTDLRAEYDGVLAAADAAVAVAEGDDARAASVLATFFTRHPSGSIEGDRLARRYPGLVHVLVPEARPVLDEAVWGATVARAAAAARWYEAILSDDPEHVAPSAPLRPLLNVLPLRWIVRAASRLSRSEPRAARQLVEDLVGTCGTEVRQLLRELAELGQDEAALEGARRLLAGVPIAPELPIEVGVLGPLFVRHDASGSSTDEVVDGALRRERVRQVLTVLAVEGTMRREDLAARLWPEHDARKASQNLRATLLHVNRVLEPQRDPGDASFVLRADGDELSLVGRPWVDTDLLQFDDAILDAAAARSDGVHSEELVHLERALSLVRGEPLADLRFEEWAAVPVRRITSDVVDAARRAAELSFADRRFTAAEAYAERCLALEPFDDVAHRYAVAAPLADGRRAAARAALDRWEHAAIELGIGPPEEVTMFRRRLGATTD